METKICLKKQKMMSWENYNIKQKNMIMKLF